jgi:hypothetical protein
MLKTKYGLKGRAESDAGASRPEKDKAGEPPVQTAMAFGSVDTTSRGPATSSAI